MAVSSTKLWINLCPSMDSAYSMKPFETCELNDIDVYKYDSNNPILARRTTTMQEAIVAAMLDYLTSGEPQCLNVVHGATNAIVVDNCSIDNNTITAKVKVEENCEFVAIYDVEYYV